MSSELSPEKEYPALKLSDEELLDKLLSLLSKSVGDAADPYSEDGSYSAALQHLPIGLRAMTATHHLDVSLTMDDIGWHFLNFGEPNLVRETETGLRELGLVDLAGWFGEAFAIVDPLRAKIASAEDYYSVLTEHGQMDRIEELTDKATNISPRLNDSPIYAAWVRYAREHPERVFAETTKA